MNHVHLSSNWNAVLADTLQWDVTIRENLPPVDCLRSYKNLFDFVFFCLRLGWGLWCYIPVLIKWFCSICSVWRPVISPLLMVEMKFGGGNEAKSCIWYFSDVLVHLERARKQILHTLFSMTLESYKYPSLLKKKIIILVWFINNVFTVIIVK